MNVLYDWGSTTTLVLSKSAFMTGLQPIRQPVLYTEGDKQVTRAYGVDDIATVALSRPLRDAGDVFPVVQASLPYMEMEGG